MPCPGQTPGPLSRTVVPNLPSQGAGLPGQGLREPHRLCLVCLPGYVVSVLCTSQHGSTAVGGPCLTAPELLGTTLPAAISALWERVQLRPQRPQRGPRGRRGRSRGSGLRVWCQAPGPECLQLRKQPAASGTKRPLSQVGKESGGWPEREQWAGGYQGGRKSWQIRPGRGELRRPQGGC